MLKKTLITLIAGAAVVASLPARADRDDWREHGWRGHGWNRPHWAPYRGYVVVRPAPVVVSPYYVPAPAYYPAPVYAQPSLSVRLRFPL